MGQDPAGDIVVDELAAQRRSLRIAFVTETYPPEVNGVALSVARIVEGLRARNHEIQLVRPRQDPAEVADGDERFREVLMRGMPIPRYPNLKMGLPSKKALVDLWALRRPDVVHIATEGPLGLAARRYAIDHDLPFTTAYHTRFPEYVQARFGIPLAATYRFLRWFHKPSLAVMAPTPVVKTDLEKFGFTNVVLWTRGVDLDIFRPLESKVLNTARPIFLYVGRVAVEKNVEAFLKLDLPGLKWVCGEGPALAELKSRYPQANYLGVLSQPELAKVYAAADVFVFPSRTDTFGLVLLEAMASGVPVAAYPVTGPKDVVVPGVTGVLHEDLGRAALEAVRLDPAACVAHAATFSWRSATLQFLNNLAPLREPAAHPAASSADEAALSKAP
jgi:glycosyltransferase involved in cell wall biosynthesis